MECQQDICGTFLSAHLTNEVVNWRKQEPESEGDGLDWSSQPGRHSVVAYLQYIWSQALLAEAPLRDYPALQIAVDDAVIPGLLQALVGVLGPAGLGQQCRESLHKYAGSLLTTQLH